MIIYVFNNVFSARYGRKILRYYFENFDMPSNNVVVDDDHDDDDDV